VRFDGGHKRNPFLTEVLDRYVEWIPVCPEDEAGLGTPREAMRLVATDAGIRLLTVRTARDLTAVVQHAAAARVEALAGAALDGYVVKKDSPSCGWTRVRVYAATGPAARIGRGLFAAALADRYPHLPVEDEGRLIDPSIREHFITRVFAHQRLRLFLSERPRAATLMRFHQEHKLQVLAHSPPAYSRLGRLAASAGTSPIEAVAAEYAVAFMAAFAIAATRARHVNVLQHMAGYFRRLLDDAARRDLADAIDDYRAGLVPLVVPVRLIAHYTRRYCETYLADQAYLAPYPHDLMLRNHV
jgi:uncharacterized protein YbgA (DUF1722 family)/uncharacterized protein YbbK (DUF523 family)